MRGRKTAIDTRENPKGRLRDEESRETSSDDTTLLELDAEDRSPGHSAAPPPLYDSWRFNGGASSSPDSAGDAPKLDQLIHLLTCANAGDRDANAELLERARQGVRGYIERRTKSWPDSSAADDVTQETVLRIFVHLRGCRARSNGEFVSWALTVAQSAVSEHFRRNVAAYSDVLLREELADRIDPASHGAWASEAENRISGGAVELIAAAMTAYAALPADLAELLYERIVGSLSWSEIAQRFGTTAAGAKRRFQRAQGRIRGAVVGHVSGLDLDRRQSAETALREYSKCEASKESLSDVAEPFSLEFGARVTKPDRGR
jgi:RNA polymerase sigma factor (sigma-70 family)